MKEVKFGIIGCGRIGTRHAEHIFNNNRAKLCAVCDILPEKAKSLAKKYNAQACMNLRELLKEKIDVINICTPSGMHAEMAVEILKNKISALCEKPMALNLEDADKIIKAEQENGQKFFLVKQNRFNPPIKALKNCVCNEKLGKLILLNCNVLWNRRKEYYDETDWRGTMKLDGGALMTQCSHFLDLMLWMGGKVKTVSAQMTNLVHPYIEIEDTGFITIRFENGCVGSLQYTTGVYKKNLEGSLTILGSKGSIKIGGAYINTLEIWDVQNTPQPVLEQSKPANDYGSYQGSMSNHDKVIENVVRVILDGEEIATNSAQGRDSIEVMQAAYISAIKNTPIELPLKEKEYLFKINEQKPFTQTNKNEY